MAFEKEREKRDQNTTRFCREKKDKFCAVARLVGEQIYGKIRIFRTTQLGERGDARFWDRKRRDKKFFSRLSFQ